MTTLLSFRDNVKEFWSHYDFVLTPIVKFIVAIIIFFSMNQTLGNVSLLNNRLCLIGIAMVAAFLSVEFTTAVAGIMFIWQTASVSLDIGLVTFAVVLIFYCGYMRFYSKAGLIALCIPVLYACHLTYAIPIVLGILVGPAAMIPIAFGVLLYYYEAIVNGFKGVLVAAAQDDNVVAGYQYILTEMLNNKDMRLTIVVFCVVVLITYIVYRMSFEYAWIVAFCVGGFTNIVLFLFATVAFSGTFEIVSIILGSIVGICISGCIQFMKGIVDYQKVDYLQFEDNEYYYYVKAIPKLSVAESNKNVKHINAKKHE